MSKEKVQLILQRVKKTCVRLAGILGPKSFSCLKFSLSSYWLQQTSVPASEETAISSCLFHYFRVLLNAANGEEE